MLMAKILTWLGCVVIVFYWTVSYNETEVETHYLNLFCYFIWGYGMSQFYI